MCRNAPAPGKMFIHADSIRPWFLRFCSPKSGPFESHKALPDAEGWELKHALGIAPQRLFPKPFLFFVSSDVLPFWACVGVRWGIFRECVSCLFVFVAMRVTICLRLFRGVFVMFPFAYDLFATCFRGFTIVLRFVLFLFTMFFTTYFPFLRGP